MKNAIWKHTQDVGENRWAECRVVAKTKTPEN